MEEDDSGLSISTERPPPIKLEPPALPMIASILAIVAWLMFILLYALFLSKSFDLFQNIVVTLVSLLVACLLIGVMWILWLRPASGLGIKPEQIPTESLQSFIR
jgi:hypothetical protein